MKIYEHHSIATAVLCIERYQEEEEDSDVTSDEEMVESDKMRRERLRGSIQSQKEYGSIMESENG